MKSKFPSQFGLYAVLTNPLVGYEKLTEILVEEKVKFIQLRIKDKPQQAIIELAHRLKAITRNSESLLIINDSPEIALEVKADGVHLGQSDRDIISARKLVGPEMIIGLSTHNVAQVIKANELKPDYIGMGPVYATPTKKMPDPVIGLAGLKQMLSLTALPAVAIGGIDLNNIQDVRQAGALNFCAVRAINNSSDPREVIRRFANGE